MKVIHVHLIFKKKDHYFGSVSAVYDYLSEQDLGIKRSTLSHRIAKEMKIVTSKAIINQGELKRCIRNLT